MTISDEDLAYDKHFRLYEGFLSGNPENDYYWHCQAQEMHALSVMQAAGDVQTQIVSIGQHLAMGPAYHHLVFGAARRSKMIWGAFRQLHNIIPPEREEPLKVDDAFEVARALNDIYIHTRGMLDNLAWTVMHMFGDEAAKALHQNDIGFFQKRFRSNQSVSEFCDIAAQFSDWINEIKTRRDPVAHRIPLSVPPAILNEAEQIEYVELNNQANEALVKMARLAGDGAPVEQVETLSEQIENLHAKMATIGKLAPFIVHDPAEGGVRVYPTVPEDIGQLVKLTRHLVMRIQQRIRT